MDNDSLIAKYIVTDGKVKEGPALRRNNGEEYPLWVFFTDCIKNSKVNAVSTLLSNSNIPLTQEEAEAVWIYVTKEAVRINMIRAIVIGTTALSYFDLPEQP